MGRHGDIAPDRAHKEAAKIIVRIKAGLPPVEPEPPPTVADLAGRYRREYVAMHCKPNTVKHYGLMLAKHIDPRLGEFKVAEVERKDILKFQFELSDMPTVANRCVDILVKMFNLSELWEMRPPGRDPCKSVRRYKVVRHKERFLTTKELARLGWVLEIAPAERLASRHAAAIRLLVLTRCRRNEIMGLAWDDLDFEAGEMRLRDSKTGGRVVPMPPPAAEVLAELPRVDGYPWVFPGRKKGTHQVNINDSWDRVRKRARLDRVRLHDLRHTFASRALAIGEGLPMIGELLGHRQVNTTARYPHLARESIQFSTAKVADNIGADILE